jgi:hypothetical protein
MFSRKTLNGPIADGVSAGLEKSFAPGGAFTRALDDALKPTFDELRELRAYKNRHSWHPMEKAPEWLKDGRPVLVSCNGDMFWAAYQAPDGEDDGYWDRDVEYGGEPCEPDLFLITPKRPVVAKSSEALRISPAEGRAGNPVEDAPNLTPPERT